MEDITVITIVSVLFVGFLCALIIPRLSKFKPKKAIEDSLSATIRARDEQVATMITDYKLKNKSLQQQVNSLRGFVNEEDDMTPEIQFENNPKVIALMQKYNVPSIALGALDKKQKKKILDLIEDPLLGQLLISNAAGAAPQSNPLSQGTTVSGYA